MKPARAVRATSGSTMDQLLSLVGSIRVRSESIEAQWFVHRFPCRDVQVDFCGGLEQLVDVVPRSFSGDGLPPSAQPKDFGCFPFHGPLVFGRAGA